MDILILLLPMLVLLGLIAVAGFAWLRRRRREPAPIEDDWPGITGSAGRSGEVLNRDTLAGRPRAFDPNAWDDSPDQSSTKAGPRPRSALREPGATDAATGTGPVPVRPESGTAPGEPAPTYLDREFLKSHEQGKRSLESEAD